MGGNSDQVGGVGVRCRWWRILVVAGLLGTIGASVGNVAGARPDLTASYDGLFTIARTQQTADLAGVLNQTGAVLVGTLALGTSAGSTADVYHLSGRLRGRRVQLQGVGDRGLRLLWVGARTADGLAGRGQLRQGRKRVTWGTMTLHRLADTTPTGGGGPPCDAPFFQDQVMAKVLVPICASCHVRGGLAEVARFRVSAGDPQATQQSVALQINPTDPAASRILQKPLAQIPHGGGQQITAGSAEEQILRQWVDIVASGQCGNTGGGGGGGTPSDLYTDNCASCHGVDARGTPGRPNIRCAASIVDPVRSGRDNGAMPAFASDVLSDANVTAIQTYLDELCTVGGATIPADLYLSNCASCHGPTAGGGRNSAGVAGPGIRCTETPDFVEKVMRGAGAMPAFPTFTRAQINAVAGFAHGFCQGGVGGD
jgi:mono/diheme cytochrome c family protein